MTVAISNVLRHPAFLALIPAAAAVFAVVFAYWRTSKKQTAIQIEVNGNMHTALKEIGDLKTSLAIALTTIARLEHLLGYKEGEEEAGHVGKSTNGGGH